MPPPASQTQVQPPGAQDAPDPWDEPGSQGPQTADRPPWAEPQATGHTGQPGTQPRQDPQDWPELQDAPWPAGLGRQGRSMPLLQQPAFREAARTSGMPYPGGPGSLVQVHRGFCIAPYDLVGQTGDLPPGSPEYNVFRRLSGRRHNRLPRQLREHGYQLSGYCLEPCANCSLACSRVVAVGARREHDKHQCPGCHD